jgi:uncharacterized protein
LSGEIPKGQFKVRPRVVPLLFVLAFGVLLRAAETPIPPSPTRWVTDAANMMSPAAVQSLDARLEAYQQSTHHQLLVYIGQTTGDDPIEDWSVHAFANWKIGRKGLDDGLALFVMSKDRKLHIEVGYGLESVVPDVIASRIIREIVVPKIQAGDADGGITAGMEAVIKAIGDQAGANPPAQQPEGDQGQPQAKPLSTFQLFLIGIGGVLLLIFVITHPAMAFFLLANIMSGGRGGGGGGGSGGFSGGGGSSGGGGASGSW